MYQRPPLWTVFTALFNWCPQVFFCHRIVKIWNELPIDTDFSSIDLFKRTLDGFNFTAYCDI